MTVLHVTVESSFAGPGSGFGQFPIDDSSQVQELIRLYCNAKGIPVSPSYALINSSQLTLSGSKTLAYYAVRENETLVLGSSQNEDSKSYRFGHWFTLAGLGFLFGVLGIIICTILYAVVRSVPENYAIVVDAGSTHSDVILYKWPGAKVNNTGEVKQVSTCYVTGGLAEVTAENVSSYFKSCFDAANLQVPSESKATAEVLLGATAGMRLLNSSDPEMAKERIAGVKAYLRGTSMVVKESNVGIIEGWVEGISGWITINFLRDTIYSEVGQLNSSWGALDLGGASTQITFEVGEAFATHPLVTQLQLFGHKFFVFSQSFLCYGVVQAMIRYRTLLLKDHWNRGQSGLLVQSPCDPVGRNVTLSQQDFLTPCLNNTPDLQRVLATGHTYTFQGTGDFSKCEPFVMGLLNTSSCRAFGFGECIDPTLLPPLLSTRKFMGFASFAYLANALKGVKNHPTKNYRNSTYGNEYLMLTKDVCSLSYQRILELKLDDPTNSFRDLENTCFKADFAYNLLSKIYGFNKDEKWRNVEFNTKVSDATLGWSLGYMINATEEISAGKSVPSLETLPFAFLTLLFILFLLISSGFVYHGMKLRKSSPTYQRKVAARMDEELVKFI